jgi:transcription initiation factor TFIID TATA-box-binding protein
LAISLGLESTEYEPEQFPGLVYRAPDGNGTIIIFASGKVVFTGFGSVNEAEADMEMLLERVH